jgi:hypothetical protein
VISGHFVNIFTRETIYFFAILPLVSLLFGVTQKIADGHDEHGLNWFPGAPIFFGLTWGLLGCVLVRATPAHFSIYFSLCLYWIFKLKIDYTNHATAIILIFISALNVDFKISVKAIISLLMTYIILDFVKVYLNLHKLWFYRYWIHFLIIPILFDVMNGNLYTTPCIVSNLVGIRLSKKLFSIT